MSRLTAIISAIVICLVVCLGGWQCITTTLLLSRKPEPIMQSSR